ncbi:MAG TPA: hypothetical protein VK752_32080 [Bryobacteraceae bacterium]|nr:hypothetical protein [Bryobacteraceae bacterium]
MKRSASVTLTLVVTLATVRAQQGGDPCAAATFNGKVCQAAVHDQGYCSQGSRTSMSYPQSYPYYFDRYADYLSHGGAANPSSAAKCPRQLSARGGFGSTAAAHSEGSKGGS